MNCVINIGCGPKVCGNPTAAFPNAEEFIRLDANPENEPDVVHDINQPLPEALVGQFDGVFSAHMLEHISWRNMFPVLHNIASAAKPDGVLYIIVPDLYWACKQIVAGKYEFDVLGVLYGGQYNQWDYHLNGFTPKTIATALLRIGWRPTRQTTAPFDIDFGGLPYKAYQIETLAVRDGNLRTDGD